jgi:hypothetical protein
MQDQRVVYAERREARRRFEERRAAKKRRDGAGKEGQADANPDDLPHGDEDDEFDMSDGTWEIEERYMSDAEEALDYLKKHPNVRPTAQHDIDPKWFSNPIRTFASASNSPAAAAFERDLNRRLVRSTDRQK